MTIVAYYRVSTQRQGRSGLGLEAQQQIVREYASRIGQEISAEFTEVESGQRCDRMQLTLAMTRARRSGATLVVAKLDRLARDAKFLLNIVDGGVSVHFCDLPNLSTGDPITGRLVLTVMAAMAEFEARRIGQRIKEAMAAKKTRGERIDYSRSKLNLTPEHRAAGCRAATVARRAISAAFRAEMRPVALDLAAQGMTLDEIARAMNEAGYRTQRGRKWTLATVHLLLK